MNSEEYVIKRIGELEKANNQLQETCDSLELELDSVNAALDYVIENDLIHSWDLSEERIQKPFSEWFAEAMPAYKTFRRLPLNVQKPIQDKCLQLLFDARDELKLENEEE